jgi:hypothetical protein
MREKFLSEEQDPKTVEKIFQRLTDMLTTGEEVLYIAVQKKPLVNLLSDCVALTSKRILFFSPANLGLSIKCDDFVWKDIVEVHTKEEIIGAVFTVVTTEGIELGVDYLPKVQARKLYQYAKERTEAEREARRLRDLEEKRAESGAVLFDNPVRQGLHQQVIAQPPQLVYVAPQPETALAPAFAAAPKPDELTEKLKKLKTLFDNDLITLEDYNQKKQELLKEL